MQSECLGHRGKSKSRALHEVNAINRLCMKVLIWLHLFENQPISIDLTTTKNVTLGGFSIKPIINIKDPGLLISKSSQ